MKLFISYSHDSDQHSDWVENLASDIVKAGIEVMLDRWNVPLGGNLQIFMEQGMSNSDRVLVICTETYNKKANQGAGGAGYEKLILTNEIVSNQNTSKFIPIIKGVADKDKTPVCLFGRRYLDLSNDALYAKNLKTLISDLIGIAQSPVVANNNEEPISTLDSTSANTSAFDGTNSNNEDDHQNDADPVLASTDYFDTCFRNAFPGLRGVKWFHDTKIIIERLTILFADLDLQRNRQKIWWWGPNGDCPIERVEKVDDNNLTMSSIEIRPLRMAAINLGSYYQKIIYVESAAFEPSGTYTHSEEEIKSYVENYKYFSEEYAVFKGHKITREEYDDNAALINNTPQSLNGQATLYIRHLTPWGFFIAPHGSPINTNNFDPRREKYLEKLLGGSDDLTEFIDEFRTLPKRPW